MKTQPNIILISLLLIFIVASCRNNPVSVTENPLTVETIIETPLQTPIIQSTQVNPSEGTITYYDGVVVLTQYYTFLGNDLHEKAYDLLSYTAKSHYSSLEKYLEIARLSFHQVEIIEIVPYKDWAPLFGIKYSKDTEDKKQFVVIMKAWGEGNMSGSAMNGQLQTLHIMLILEDEKWKIDEFSGAIPFNP